METKLRTSVELITPEMALEYLTHNKVNRPLNKGRVEFYAEQMRKGEWLLNGEGIHFTRNGDMVNGQHRLNAVIKSETPTNFLVVRNVDDDSFTTYDSGRNRGLSDVFSIAEVPNYVQASSLIRRYVNLKNEEAFINGSRSSKLIGGLRVRRLPSKEFLDIYNENSENVQYIIRFCSYIYSKTRLIKQSEMGGIFLFLINDKKHPQEFVESFFRMFANPKMCNYQCVDLLREFMLREYSCNKTHTPMYMTQIFIKTWNTYCKGITETKLLRWNESVEGKLQFM